MWYSLPSYVQPFDLWQRLLLLLRCERGLRSFWRPQTVLITPRTASTWLLHALPAVSRSTAA